MSRVHILVVACAFLSILLPHGARAFDSAEVRFADPSASGLAIVPASCPSSPDYSGQCDPGGGNPPMDQCSIFASPSQITQGQSATLYWNGNQGPAIIASGWQWFAYGSGAITSTDPSFGTQSVGMTGSLSISPSQTATYTYDMTAMYGATWGSGNSTGHCDGTVVVNPSNCPTPATASDDSNGYRLPGGTSNARITKSGYDFCISNGGSSYYFVPAKSSTELQSFYNAIPHLNGVSQQAP